MTSSVVIVIAIPSLLSPTVKFLSLRFTCLDAHPADVLSDVVPVSKVLEFLKAPQVIELPNLLLDGTGRAEGDALAALAA
jgi:hypothetical protein